MSAPLRALRLAALGLAFSLALAAPQLAAQEAPPAEQPAPAAETAPGEPELPSFFATTTVTAVGREVDTFEVATPVTVIPQIEIERRAPNNAADLLRDQPGVDVNGIGPNQGRPVIRGQRGLRVLFLENGLRMNNARRQTDFGEITGLVDMDAVTAMEVVRGPASVLYGSDAIGGVLNLVTKLPSMRSGSALGGSLDLRYGSAAEMQRAGASLGGRRGPFSFLLSGSYRDGSDYDTPTGSFGDIRIADPVRVEDSGIRDDSLYGVLGLALGEGQDLSLRLSRYRADQTGFGFVDPAAIGGDESALVRILYPYQNFDRATLSWDATTPGFAAADTLQARAYYQSNERELVNDIFIDIGPIFPGAPSSSVEVDSTNYTDLDTWGLRTEAIKLLGRRNLLTYGVEFYRDDSVNTDLSTTRSTIRFPFPPFERATTTGDAVSNAPNAVNESWGLFVQDEITATDRLRLTLGARYQNVATRAQATPGWEIAGLDFDDDAFVGSATATYQVFEPLNLLASYGRGFRAPNIIERLFNGPTPEGNGFQILNADLVSEASDNFDVGLKYRRRQAYLEVVYFRNEIRDGIIQDFLSPAEIAALPAELRDRIQQSGAQFVVQQRNLDELRYEGLEIATGYRHASGVTVGGNYTHLSGKRVGGSAAPVEDQYSDKIAGFVRYEAPSGRFWTEYRVRHNAAADVRLEEGEPLPAVGDELPAFTIHTLAGGVTLFQRGNLSHSLTLAVENLTDELYAEFSNATFFRPETGRNVVASYRLRL
ncbi:MAG: TonB-dependent receptor [Thermoanaerobaculia bacterium]|nr:TonB-dependent receptor [Thermoanaerobaculia bacterium]